jgi:hypothetical protein
MRLIGTVYPHTSVRSDLGGLTFEIDDTDRVDDPTVLERAAARETADEFSLDTYLREVSGSGVTITVPEALANIMVPMVESMMGEFPESTNYLETIVTSKVGPRRWVIITARAENRTPHALRLAAEKRAEQAEAEVVRLTALIEASAGDQPAPERNQP